MSTVIRSEISKKNKYWISKHRHLELKHFCLQYPEWKRELRDSIWLSREGGGDPQWSDPTGKNVEIIEELVRKISMVERCAMLADEQIGQYILKAVTEDLSFVTLSMVYEVPCGKDMYYDRYRRFFWLLSRY